MVGALLTALVILQQQPQVTARVDQTDVEVGDEIVLVITAEASGSAQIELAEEPRLFGLTLLGTRQATNFRADGAVGVRVTTWEFDLRATSSGTATIGPIDVRVGRETVRAAAITISVRAVTAGGGAAMAARIERIVDRAPGPDGSDDVIVTVIPSPDTIVLGDQLDLVVVAWFPRDVRSRLRTRPTLTPPEVRGAWTYSQTSALGVSATRRAAGREYDLFVHHQVVFPLTSGAFVVGPATVSYNLPLRMSILSREIPQEVQSRTLEVAVLAQPLEGRPPAFGGSAARGLRLGLTADTAGFAIGNGGSLAFTLSGRGNVSLWPEPVIEWPPGLRVYQGRTDVQIESADGIVGGVKTFNYLLAADSLGSFAIPRAGFTHYDLDSRRYRTVETQPLRLVARAGLGRVLPAEELPALVQASGEPRALAVANLVPWWSWVVFLAGPPGLFLLILAVRALRGRSRRRIERGRAGGLAAAHESFRRALELLVRESRVRDGEGLVSALRAAGVEAPVAQHAARVRDRLRRAIYGPESASDPDELIAEVREVLGTLPVGRPRHGRVAASAISVVMALLWVGAAHGQAPAEQLYDAGVFLTAADSFAARAARMPNDPAHWLNLGSALYAAEEYARARAAWIRAARLNPRDPAVRESFDRIPDTDLVSKQMIPVFLFTPAEAAILGAVLWLSGWLCLFMRFRRAIAVPLLAAGLLCGAYSAFVQQRYRERTAIVARANTPLRSAPYGTAPTTRALSEDSAVRVTRADGAWLLVQRGDAVGWVLADDVEAL